jgi:FkbM family methyltransferase
MTSYEFGLAVNVALEEPAANQTLAQELLSGTSKRPCFVVGRNEQASELTGKLQLNGLLDDFAEPGSTWRGLPTVSTEELPPSAIVINCSTSISPIDVEQKIKLAGKAALVSIHELIYAAAGGIAQPWFVCDQRQDWKLFEAEWSAVFASLHDEPSRQALLDVVRYRLTANTRIMQNYKVRMEDQYFEPFLDLRSEVFVDAGGFDGDTTEQFCRRHPDYLKVHLFEPSQRNMRAANIRLGAYRDIIFHQEGLSDRAGGMTFDAEAGSASAVTSGSGEEVQMTTLDLAVTEPVTLIKMDLEGWEMTALAGCEQHIRKDRPKLAIAVYHRASDFRTIWRYARSLHPDYKVYLRHYTQGWSETVMFFV